MPGLAAVPGVHCPALAVEQAARSSADWLVREDGLWEARSPIRAEAARWEVARWDGARWEAAHWEGACWDAARWEGAARRRRHGWRLGHGTRQCEQRSNHEEQYHPFWLDTFQVAVAAEAGVKRENGREIVSVCTETHATD